MNEACLTIVNTEEKYLADLGFRIKQLKEEKSFDQKAFAFYCDIGRTQLYMKENEKTNPRILTLWKIAKGLGLEMTELLG